MEAENSRAEALDETKQTGHQPEQRLMLADEDDEPGELIAWQELADAARKHIHNSKAANTRRAYRSDWNDFTEWCRHHRRDSLPALPETVALYLTDCAKGLKPSTIQRRMASITEAHKTAGHQESPTKHAAVRAVWQGIRRSKGVAMEGKAPALTADLRVMIEHLPKDKLLSVRDRALLLIGFAGAMRRSELVGLDYGDVADTEEGLIVTIRRSKTDQYGSGRKIGLPFGSTPSTCPVRAFRNWIKAANVENGSLFRAVDRHGRVSMERLSDQTVARVVKRALKAAGRDAEKFSGHSLRAGLATQAAMNGATERSIQEQTGHKSLLILRRYIRDGNLFRENAAAKTGL
jgi:site-specific recombinase XerD